VCVCSRLVLCLSAVLVVVFQRDNVVGKGAGAVDGSGLRVAYMKNNTEGLYLILARYS
jgi:hypothetical protein